jgi:type II secretory pathway pseudopilin PulG
MTPRPRPQGGFTFVEILITLVFLSIAMLAMTSQFPLGLSVSQSAEDLTLATNLAQELMEEIRSMRWEDPQIAGAPLGPDSGEYNRFDDYYRYDDIDDYDGLVEAPPYDLDGNPLNGQGGRANLARYERDVTVTYADETTLAATASVTGLKRIEVGVSNVDTGQRSTLVLIKAWKP